MIINRASNDNLINEYASNQTRLLARILPQKVKYDDCHSNFVIHVYATHCCCLSIQAEVRSPIFSACTDGKTVSHRVLIAKTIEIRSTSQRMQRIRGEQSNKRSFINVVPLVNKHFSSSSLIRRCLEIQCALSFLSTGSITTFQERRNFLSFFLFS